MFIHQTVRRNRSEFKIKTIMKTLDYLHLDEQKVQGVVSALHSLLADFQVFYTNLRGFHWDIEGHGFFVLHGKFEDLYDDTAEKADQIAERILMLGGKPENRFSEYLRVAKVKEISGVTRGDGISSPLTATLSARSASCSHWLRRPVTRLPWR
jgi:starvation-inducible DNA-binding protein